MRQQPCEIHDFLFDIEEDRIRRELEAEAAYHAELEELREEADAIADRRWLLMQTVACELGIHEHAWEDREWAIFYKRAADEGC